MSEKYKLFRVIRYIIVFYAVLVGLALIVNAFLFLN